METASLPLNEDDCEPLTGIRRPVRTSKPLVGQSRAFGKVHALIQQVAATDSTVLLLGETGTGKELVASLVHDLSGRRARSMVRVNCAAIPATLIESELFGRERGAFTDAIARQVGRFELADRSTIFLDEIGDLPAEVQVKLLRVLEDRHIERLGSPRSIPLNVRVIAATHRQLEERVAAGSFRSDLFYRLNVFPIHVPPLRERTEDIPLLVWHFVREFSAALDKRIDSIPPQNMELLRRHTWPGNIRELRNVVERAMVVATGPELTITLPMAVPEATIQSVRLADVQKAHILGVLESVGWRIRGTGGAADRLGLRPTTLETRMMKQGLFRPRHPARRRLRAATIGSQPRRRRQRIVTARVSWNCRRVSAGSRRCSSPVEATTAPVTPPTAAPISAPSPPPAMPPTMAPSPAPPPTFLAVRLPSPLPVVST